MDKNSLPQQQGEDMMVDRGRYARICVEVDLSRKLRSRVVLRRRAFRVEYEGLGLVSNVGGTDIKQTSVPLM